MRAKVTLVLWFCMVLVCSSAALAKRPEQPDGQGQRIHGPKFNFGDCGGVKACLGEAGMGSLLRTSGLEKHRTVDELAKMLDEDDDLGVDMENSMLIVSCSGMLSSPVAPDAATDGLATAAAATAATAATPVATDNTDPLAATNAQAVLSAVATADTDDAATASAGNRRLLDGTHSHSHGGHHHHHHHHHRRSVLQRNQPSPALAPAPAPVTSPAQGILPSTLDSTIPGGITQAGAFTLHSRPASPRKILLDFDGHTTVNTAWNTLYNKPTIITPPYDKDGNRDTWSADELADIVAIWRAVAEDFAAFDVDITTEDPGADTLATSGTRVAIGGAYQDWLGTAAGGVAYIPSFGKPEFQPAFVFAVSLSNYAKYVWESVSHEIGHTLGLSHDLDVSGTYSQGVGSWAPIMGSAYYKQVTQFGPTPQSPEDDFGIMSTFLPYVPQEQGSTMALPTDLPMTRVGTSNTFRGTVAAIISKPSDVDMFRFVVPSTISRVTVTVQLRPVAPWGTQVLRSNLHSNVVVRRGTSQILQANGFNVGPFTTSRQQSGTFFVSVAPTGVVGEYTAYGSRGQYELTVTYQAA